MSIYDNHLATNATSGPLWVTATYYNIGDFITHSGQAYICLTAHTSGTFATDFGNGYWTIGLNPSTSILMPVFDQTNTIIVRGTVLGGTAPSLAGSTPSNTPSAPTSAVLTATGSGTTPSLAGSTPSHGGGTPALTGGATIRDLGAYKVSLNQASNFNSPVTTGTITMQSGTATPVLNGTFDVLTSNLTTGSNTFQTKVTSGSPGTSANYTLSNKININASVITNTQISNTFGAQQYSDASNTTGTSVPYKFITFNSNLYFVGKNQNQVTKLFQVTPSNVVTQVSNTANSQTAADFDAQGYLYDWSPIVLGSHLFFLAYDGTGTQLRLMRMDTSGNIIFITDANTNISYDSSYFTARLFLFNSKIYFLAYETAAVVTTGGTKLWSSDESGNVQLVTNINPGFDDFHTSSSLASGSTGGSLPFNPIIFNSKMYLPLQVNVTSSGTGQWKLFSISTGGVLKQVSDINSGGNNDFANNNSIGGAPGWTPVIFNSNLYFFAFNSNTASKLFQCTTSDVITQMSNTTGSQTSSDSITAGYDWSSLIVFNNYLYFAANNSYGPPAQSMCSKLYKIDTSNNITQVANLSGIQSVDDGLTNNVAFVCNSVFYFSGTSLYGATRLYSIDTSNNLTTAISNVDSQSYPSAFANAPVVINGNSFYIVMNSLEAPEAYSGGSNPPYGSVAIPSIYQYSSGVLTRAVKTGPFAGAGDNTNGGSPALPNNTFGTIFNGTLYFWGNNIYGAGKLFHL